MKFELRYSKNVSSDSSLRFHSRIVILKCRLQNASHLVCASSEKGAEISLEINLNDVQVPLIWQMSADLTRWSERPVIMFL